jgi:hypothetical protein
MQPQRCILFRLIVSIAGRLGGASAKRQDHECERKMFHDPDLTLCRDDIQ